MKKVNIDWSKHYSVSDINDDMIEFSNGAVISFRNNQESYQHIYLDFSYLHNNVLFKNIMFKYEPRIEIIDNTGIRLNNFFIPCYNSQSESYNSLNLIFNWKESLDITKACRNINTYKRQKNIG